LSVSAKVRQNPKQSSRSPPSVVNCAFVALQPTSLRLGVVEAPTTLPAGYNVSSLHCRFCGATAAITPNRPLGGRPFITLPPILT